MKEFDYTTVKLSILGSVLSHLFRLFAEDLPEQITGAFIEWSYDAGKRRMRSTYKLSEGDFMGNTAYVELCLPEYPKQGYIELTLSCDQRVLTSIRLGNIEQGYGRDLTSFDNTSCEYYSYVSSTDLEVIVLSALDALTNTSTI